MSGCVPWPGSIRCAVSTIRRVIFSPSARQICVSLPLSESGGAAPPHCARSRIVARHRPSATGIATTFPPSVPYRRPARRPSTHPSATTRTMAPPRPVSSGRAVPSTSARRPSPRRRRRRRRSCRRARTRARTAGTRPSRSSRTREPVSRSWRWGQEPADRRIRPARHHEGGAVTCGWRRSSLAGLIGDVLSIWTIPCLTSCGGPTMTMLRAYPGSERA